MAGRTSAAVAILLLALVRPALAQAPLTLTVEEAIARGLAHAPRLAESRAQEAAAGAATSAREALGRPTVTAIGAFLRTNHVEEFGVPQPNGSFRVLFPDIPSNYRLRAELAVPVYTGGRVGALVDAASADERAAAADRRGVEQDLRLEITRAYWTFVTAAESVAVLERTDARMVAWVQDVRSRVDAGLLSPHESLTAQAQRARQSVQLIQARQAATVARLDLARLIGAGPDQVIVPSSPVDQPAPAAGAVASLAADALLARAKEQRPERDSLIARADALAAGAEAAAATTRPQVAALAAVEPSRPNARFVPRTDEWRTSWDLGVSVSWPLFDGGKARAERAVAASRAEAIRRRVEDFDALVALEVRQRQLDLESSRAAYDATAEAVSAATEARRVLAERFAAGVATTTDLLDADLALREAELERTRLAASVRLAEARLLRALGALE
jgi:outer membrane protein TolC